MGALNLPTIAAGQLQPYQTSNDADAALESAVADPLSVDLSSGDVTLTEADFTRAVFFISHGNAVPRTINLPEGNAHLFVVYNGGSDVLTVADSTIAASVAAGDSAVLYADGTSGGLYIVSASSGSAGTAGGDLTGTYPNPTIANSAKAGPRFKVSVSDAPAASVNNYAPSGWSAATTQRLRVTPFAGGSTITGFDATGVVDGNAFLLLNESASDLTTVSHDSGSSTSANRSKCPGATDYKLPPLQGVIVTYVVDHWRLA